ncbi:MAG TPA: MFS transporter [Acidimicrobiales bacterium]|nr:MFS transporter [Acidimicrobiales bacterium]
MTETQTKHHQHPALALAVIACAQLMVILDATIVNVALPAIDKALHFSTANLEWVITSYALTFGGLLLFGGRTGDLYGKRRMFMIGIGLFAVASLLCGLATDQIELIITRGLQGIGGAIASPTALSLVAINFDEGPERNRAMGVYSGMSAVGGALGLLLGGILTTYVSWRWIFFVNVPIAAVGLLLAPRVLDESSASEGRLDTPGAITATAGMLSLVYGLTNASLHPWSAPGTVIPLGLAAVLLALFVAIELRVEAPLMPLSIFRSRNRSGSYAIMLALGVAVFSMFFFLTLYMQDVKGYSAVRTGLGFLPMSIGIMIAAVSTAKLMNRIGIRIPLAVGPAFATIGLLLLSRITPTTSYWGIIVPLVIMAVGMGQCFVPLTVTVMAGVANEEAGLASALLNTGQQVGGALGLSILGTVAAGATHHVHTARALVHGFTVAFEVGAGIAAGALLISLLVLRTPKGPLALPDEAEAVLA